MKTHTCPFRQASRQVEIVNAADPRQIDNAYDIKLSMVKMLGNVLYTTARRNKTFYGSEPIETWDYEMTAGPRAARLKVRAGLHGKRLYAALTEPAGKMLNLRAFFSPRVIPGWELPGMPSVETEGDSIVIEALYPDALQVKTTYLDVSGETTSLRSKSSTSAILGLTEDWRYASIIFTGMDSHGAFTGQSGSGKTTTLRTIIGQLARSDTAQFAIIDGKGGGKDSLDDMATLKGLVGPIAHSVEEAVAVTEYIDKEMARRNDASLCETPFYLVVDEFYIYTAIPELSRWFDRFGRGARSKNGHLLFGSQRTDAESWGIAGKALQGQFGNIVLHRMMNPNDVKTVTGYTYPPAHTLAGEGDAYYQSIRYGTQRIQVALLSPLDYQKVLGNEPGAAWQTHPDTDGRFSCRQKMVAVYIASERDKDARKGGRGSLQTLLEQLGEPEKSNATADDLLAIGRDAYYEFKESYGGEDAK